MFQGSLQRKRFDQWGAVGCGVTVDVVVARLDETVEVRMRQKQVRPNVGLRWVRRRPDGRLGKSHLAMR